MSTVDAAIIRTLIEHINNGSGGSQDIDMTMFTPVNEVYEGMSSWTTGEGNVAFKVTTGGFNPLRVGDLLRLQRTDGTFITALCTEKFSYEPYPGAPELQIIWKLQSSTGGTYECWTNSNSTIVISRIEDEVLVPDNVTTGLFRLNLNNLTSIDGFILSYLGTLTNLLDKISHDNM